LCYKLRTNIFHFFIRSVANCLSEIDQQEETGENELGDDIEMASIAEEEDELDEKFAHQGTSMGKHGGKKKVVNNIKRTLNSVVLNTFYYSCRLSRTLNS
jgi:hypothetical protein